jgi:hypothetical protein
MAQTKGKFGANLDDEELLPGEAPGTARITTAGINHNLKITKFQLTEFDGKGANKGKKFKALELELENEEGETHRELIFEPPSDEDDVTWQADKYTIVEGKRVKSGKLSNKEMVVVLNNDVVHFLLDLADALGYSYDKGKEQLGQANSFEELIKIFKKNFTYGEKKRISAKLLYDNNTKQSTSYLRLKSMLSYYPFKADIFDVWVDKRQTVLFISEYENKNKMKATFDNSQAPATGSGTSSGEKSSETYSGPAQTANSGSAAEDPF